MWDEAGQQRSVANYEKGLKHGEWALWDADGSVTESGQYSRNKKHGTWTTIGPEGEVETQWNQEDQVE